MVVNQGRVIAVASSADVPPIDEAPAPTHHSNRRLSPTLITLCGYAYMVFTMACSVAYINILKPHVANDYWWQGFNSTGLQTFLSDWCNAMLLLNRSGTYSLFDERVVLPKNYASPSTFIDLALAAPRSILQGDVPFALVVPAIRSNSVYWNLRQFVKYCWVDLDKRYEVGLTAKQQARCYSQHASNAAVYLEPILRNVDAADVLEGPMAQPLVSSIYDQINTTASGQAWLAATLGGPASFLSVDAEVAYWVDHGASHWQSEVTNYYQQGLEETLVIENALGLTQTIRINEIPFAFRGLSLWTMVNAYIGVWNDLWSSLDPPGPMSLIRSAPNSIEAFNATTNFYFIPSATAPPVTAAFVNALGPLGNVNIRLVPYPNELIVLYLGLQDALYRQLETNASFVAAYNFVPVSTTVYPTPSSWTSGARYYTGNLMCTSETETTSFVQESFGFYDSCSQPTPLTIAFWRQHVVLAAALANEQSPLSVCALASSGTRDSCVDALSAAKRVPLVVPPLDAVHAALSPLQISMFQVAAPSQLLSQAMLSETPWDLFGWITLLEWLHGRREVYRFETDGTSVTVISRTMEPRRMAANPLELPVSACKYIWSITLYVTIVINVIMVLMVGFACREPFRVCGHDLFKVNRVVGCTWIGRPFLFVRGVTALALLSTSPIDFVQRNGLSRLVLAPRSLFEIVLIAGEGTWITYVVSDFFLPFTKDGANASAPISSFLAWLTMVLLERFAPYHATLTLERRCVFSTLGLEASCRSGSVAIGSVDRLSLLLCINTATVFVSILAVGILQHCASKIEQRGPRKRQIHLLIPAASEGYLTHTHERHWYMDQVICVMSGLVPLGRGMVLDMKLWLLFEIDAVFTAQTTLQATTPLGSRVALPQVQDAASSSVPPRSTMRVQAALGLLYMAVSLFGSYSFLYLSQFAMSNDFWWAYFNATGSQTYMTNWFNDRLQVVTNLSEVSPVLDDAIFFSNDNLYNTSATATSVPVLYANMIQDEINSLRHVIDGLRTMDGCAIPWIATSYCFVDWGQTWSLAPSSSREAACARHRQNAAVYLESVLRNAHWPSLSHCWGDALNISVLLPLQSVRAGQQWTLALYAANAAPLSIEDEAVTWRRAGLVSFTTLWQNYKALGVIERFEIHNAFGLAYALNLKSSNATLQLGTQTSYKMFTPLAFSLSLVRENATGLGARSLIRGTPTYGYTNVSAATVLMQNGSLPNPVGLGLSLLNSSIGPFGEIDLRRLPCPDVVKQWYETAHAMLTLVITANDAAVHDFTDVLQSPNQYTPSPWPNATAYYGGNLLCDSQASPDDSVLTFFTLGGSCMAHMNDLLGVNTMSATMAVTAMGSALTQVAIDDIDAIAIDGGKTLDLLYGILGYLDAHVPSENRTLLSALATNVRADMQTNYPVALAQYISFNVSLGAGIYGSGPPLLAQGQLFDTTSRSYEYFSWLYLIEWVHGVREVVVFESSVGRVTTFSGRNAIAHLPVNGMEIPINVATYFQRVVQYITIVLGFVTLLASVYIVTSGGYIEASNLLVVNRVGGLVWIGRPLLFLRSMTAICLLSTSGLQLMQMAGYFRFESVQTPWYTTITASGELTWLAFIFNDAFSLLTQQYTSGYSSKSALAVWGASAIWSFVSPITHHVQLERTCVVVAVDAQAICRGGHVAIGSVERFVALNGLVCAIVLVLYGVERLRFPQLARSQGSSFFLYAAANYQFKKARWHHRDVYCIDKASAVINGLLSFEWGDRVFLLDIKTWRKHIVAIGKERREIREDPSLQHLAHTIPMKH